MKKGLMRSLRSSIEMSMGGGACVAVGARNAAKYNTCNVGNHYEWYPPRHSHGTVML